MGWGGDRVGLGVGLVASLHRIVIQSKETTVCHQRMSVARYEYVCESVN